MRPEASSRAEQQRARKRFREMKERISVASTEKPQASPAFAAPASVRACGAGGRW
jgi:hypothetical protein